MAQNGTLIGIVVGTVAAIGGGFAFGFMGLIKSPAPPPEPAAAAATAAAKAPAQKPSEVRTLTPIVVNLREPSDLYVRLEAAVVLEPGAPDGAAIAAKVGDDLVSYVKTVSLSELEGPTGFQYFREDLRRRAVQIGGGKVKELLLQSFIVQ
jgi:flagellar protein FliL